MANQVRNKNRKQKILVSRLVLRNQLLVLILLAIIAKIDLRNKVDREPEMGEKKEGLAGMGGTQLWRSCFGLACISLEKGKEFCRT